LFANAAATASSGFNLTCVSWADTLEKTSASATAVYVVLFRCLPNIDVTNFILLQIIFE
jgi:hypothetical protein